MRTSIEKKARHHIRDDVWERFRAVCRVNMSGRKYFVGDALTEALELWIDKIGMK